MHRSVDADVPMSRGFRRVKKKRRIRRTQRAKHPQRIRFAARIDARRGADVDRHRRPSCLFYDLSSFFNWGNASPVLSKPTCE
jgi:hypothetical protein